MAGSSRALVLLLLFVAVAAVAAARDTPWHEEKTFFPGALDPGKIAACWSSLLSIPSCSREVLTSFLTFPLQIGPECCKSIDKIGRNCFENIFYNPFLPFPPFNPFVGAKLICKNPNLPAPPTSPAAELPMSEE